MRRLLTALGGLRGRLVLAFTLVALISAVTATALAYREARNALLDRAQTRTATEFRERVGQEAAELTAPPNEKTLRRLAEALAQRMEADIQVRYGDLSAASSQAAADAPITTDLRQYIADRGRLAFQRVERAGEPWLAVGTPVTLSRTGDRSVLEVYALVSLVPEERGGEAMLTAVRSGTLPVLALATVLALLAAATVLRPVRSLDRATAELAAGKLDTRVPAKGRGELARLARTFNSTAAALESSVEELREQDERARRFVADVSHELRTPLAAMTMVATVLDEDADQLPPDTAAAARTVSAETAKLSRLVDDLIEISRFDAHAARLNVSDTDIADTVRAALAARGWTGQVAAELPEGIWARVDRRRLDVIVANLVGNALRHGAPPVTVALTETRDEVLLTVADCGPGLSPEACSRVFDRFYKADAARTRSEGSGLGMAIALENARLHGGSIDADERPGGGALFTLRLPHTLRNEAEPCGA